MSHYDEQYEREASRPSGQVGGTHYTSKIQPIDYIKANNLDFFQGNVIKYVTRYKSKGGLEDLRKAKHYIELLIQQEL
tara:strand:+ start:898 stop:1131 length:234 start_codon:yes stop_codon:yes gene_type:complete